jgi:NADP-dependent 3-hydroxy acid dehydrogenase YdfG
VQNAESNAGPVDILVCNHGLGSAHEVVILGQEIKTWETMMRINLDAHSTSLSSLSCLGNNLAIISNHHT